MTNHTDTNQASEVKRNSLNKSDIDVKLEPMTNQASEDDELAKLFHDTYERLAPAFSYKTRKASAVPWTDVPPNNKGLMIAVAHEINDAIRTEKLKLLDRLHHEYYEVDEETLDTLIEAERNKLKEIIHD